MNTKKMHLWNAIINFFLIKFWILQASVGLLHMGTVGFFYIFSFF